MTLKYRAPDRYTAAGSDVRCTQEVDDDDVKFEEDVVPPFVSKFAYSVSFKSKDLPLPTPWRMLWPSSPALPPMTFPAHADACGQRLPGHRSRALRRQAKAGQDADRTRRRWDARLRGQGRAHHWYLRPDENDYPLVTEFSFGFDADGQKDDDRLEKFPPTVVASANRLFRDVQNQAGWLAQFGSTKTAYAFEVL